MVLLQAEASALRRGADQTESHGLALYTRVRVPLFLVHLPRFLYPARKDNIA